MSMKKQNRLIETSKKMLLLIAVALLAISLTKLAYFAKQQNDIYDMKEFNASFGVTSKRIGLAADTNNLNFGMVSPGGSSTRQLMLYHNYTKPLKVLIVYSGSIAPILKPIEPFYLQPNTQRNISITAYAPSRYGNYSGTVKVIYLKT